MPRSQDQDFTPDERLYRALRDEDFLNGTVLGRSIDGLPRPSFNRSKYGEPSAALAAKPERKAIAWTTVKQVTGAVDNDEPAHVELCAAPFDAPTDDPGGVSHCEVRFWVATDTPETAWEPTRSQKSRMRAWLAKRLRVLVDPCSGAV